jgi:5-methylcytosine-specific restriction enzyme A
MATKRPRLTTLRSSLPTLKDRIPVLKGGGSWRSDKNGSTARGYDYRWQKASKAFLAKHPLCECDDCQEGEKRVTVATVVDHHIPHRGDMALFWDRSNWRSMAKACHDKKTQKETAALR